MHELSRTRLTAAEALSQRQSYLMATAGHDLRQPLQVILMVMDRLLPRLSPPDRVYADMAVTEIGRLARGLNDLARASVDTGSAAETTDLAPLSVSRLMDDVAASWGLHAAAKGLRIRVVPSQLSVVSDRSVVTTILRNLVGNAVKYTDHGGVLVAARRRAGTVRIEVWDTGPGIAFEDLPHILTPFYQSDQSCDGIGLGLAIARHSAALIGATIEVETRVGRGSCFAICLPADVAE